MFEFASNSYFDRSHEKNFGDRHFALNKSNQLYRSSSSSSSSSSSLAPPPPAFAAAEISDTRPLSPESSKSKLAILVPKA